MTTHLWHLAVRLYTKKNRIFKQDSAPSRLWKSTKTWITVSRRNLIIQEDWTSFALDINPLNHFLQVTLKMKVNVEQQRLLNIYKDSTLRRWGILCFKIIRTIVGQWLKSISLVIDKDCCLNLYIFFQGKVSLVMFIMLVHNRW